MNKFLFKSTNADFQKFNQLLETIQKNILYTTYQTDKILKLLKLTQVDKNLQNQVDEYFEETSPQTDQDNIGEAPDSD